MLKLKKSQVSQLWKALILVLVVAAVFIWQQAFYSIASKDQVRVFFCDVGQGDAILIDFGDNQQALVDAGPSKQVLSCLGQHLPFYDKTIEYLILTHPDADHLAGMIPLIEEYEVGQILHTGVKAKTKLYQRFQVLIKEKNIKTRLVKANDIISPTDLGKLKIIYPKTIQQAEEQDNVNNSSIVAILDVKRIEILLTGDAESEVWQEIQNQIPKVEVLKIAHHGAKNGTDEILLKQTRPEAAVISVGAKNSYGHPTVQTLNFLQEYNIEVFRTDQQGTIELRTNGEEYTIH